MKEAIEKDKRQILSWLGEYGKFLLGDKDLVLANFEGAIYDKASPREKKLPATFTIGYSYKNAEFLRDIKHITLSLSNNHIADFGCEGIKETSFFLDRNNIPFTGVGVGDKAYESRKTLCNGINISFLAFTDLLPEKFYSGFGEFGVAKADPEIIKKAIIRAKTESEIVLVSLHTAENIISKFSFFPDKRQSILAKIAVESGATVVFGHQQHGFQSVEKYKDSLIFHSLGALIYDPSIKNLFRGTKWYESTKIYGGGVVELDICKHGVRDVKLNLTKMSYVDGDFLLKKASILYKLLISIYLFFIFKTKIQHSWFEEHCLLSKTTRL